MAELKLSKKDSEKRRKADQELGDLVELLKSGTLNSLDDLQNGLELLKAGVAESFEQIKSVFETESKALNNYVKCLALLQKFDKSMFEFIQRITPFSTNSKVSFDSLKENFQIEAIPRSSDFFRVRDDVRHKCLSEWKNATAESDREKYAPFFDKLVEKLESGGPGCRLDLLGVLILSNPAKAVRVFSELYETTDKLFDLAGCHEVLRTLEDRVEIQNDELRELCREKRQYLNTRSFFATEYYQTVFYYPRQQIIHAFDDLLNMDESKGEGHGSSGRPWIFHLYAKGGMGKTMFIRWLIARYLITEPHRIPVARLDFDFLYLPIVERFPWLLLLAIAEQLNGQIEKSPFAALLNAHGQYLPLLRPPEADSNGQARRTLEEALTKINYENIKTILEKQSDDLVESEFQKPFLIVLDTLEEMVLHHKSALELVIKYLDRFRRYFPSMRLFLSGRYNLLKELPQIKAEFEGATVVHELELFDTEESKNYLHVIRNLKDLEIVSAIIEKCESVNEDEVRPGSNPFALSLFADLYEQGDVETPEDILSSPSVELAYLIRRVIMRIKEPVVRWLIRYAVVPQNFTFDFFEKVVLPRLRQQLNLSEEEVEGDVPVDRPNKILTVRGAVSTTEEAWPKPAETDLGDSLKIWDDLRKYASSHGFISFEGAGDGTPRLHPDVVMPMRLLLEDQPVFRPLHEDAAKYFEKKAVQSAADWEQNIRQAIYHHFHYDDGAPDFWRRQFEEKKAQKEPLVRLAIAEELTTDDFTDEEGFAILMSHKEPLIDEAVLYEAHLRAVEAAVAAIVTVDSSKVIDLRINLQRHLDYVVKLHIKGVRPSANYRMPFHEEYFHPLIAQMRELQWNDADLTSLLREAIKITTSQQMLLSLEIHLGDVLARNGKDESLDHYRKALSLCETTSYLQISRGEILARIGLWHYSRNDYELAQKRYLEALSEDGGDINFSTRRQILRYLADVNLKLGQYEQAFHYAEKFQSEKDEKIHFEDVLFLGQIEARALHNPLSALDRITRYKNYAEPRNDAALAKFYGDVYSMLMKIDEASTQYEISKQLWNSALSLNGVERIRIARIKLHLLQIGNFYEAASLLDDWERKTTEVDLDIAFQIRLLAVLLDYQNGDPSAAREKWLAIINDTRLKHSPRSEIRAFAAGLAFNFDVPNGIRNFIDKLKNVETAAARLALLDVFQYMKEPFKATSPEKQSIMNLVVAESKGRDFIPHAILLADVLRGLGENDRAARLLNESGAMALSLSNSFSYRQVLLAKDRLGPEFIGEANLFHSSFMNDFTNFPMICAAAYLEQAERSLKKGDIYDCRANLVAAQELLPRGDSTTTRLEAKLNELFGEAIRTESFSDAVNSEEKLPLWATSFNLALAVYEKLGDKAGVARMRANLPSVEQPVFSDHKSFSVRLQKTGEVLSTELFHGGNLIEPFFIPSASPSLIEAVTAETRDESKFYSFSKEFIGNLPSVLEQLGNIICLKKIFNSAAPHQPGSLDLKLDSFSPAVAKIPWELAISQSIEANPSLRCVYRSASDAAGNIERIKWLQIAIRNLQNPGMYVDGIFGPETKAALTELKMSLNLPANSSDNDLRDRLIETMAGNRPTAKILLIQPNREQQIRSHHFQYQSSEEISSIYQYHNASVQTLWANELNDFKSTIKRFQPDIIHIQSSFNSLPNSGQMLLDFVAEDNYSNRSSYLHEKNYIAQLSPVFFNDALTLLPENRMRPLILLDAVCPPGVTQTVHQLLYRNVFASEIFQFGNAAGIIAMGLSENLKLQYDLLNKLIENLLGLKTFAAAVNSVRSTFSTLSLNEKIAVEGVALFTNAPSLTVLPVGNVPDKFS